MLSGGTEIVDGIGKHEPKSVLDVEGTSGNSQRTSSWAVITDGDQPQP